MGTKRAADASAGPPQAGKRARKAAESEDDLPPAVKIKAKKLVWKDIEKTKHRDGCLFLDRLAPELIDRVLSDRSLVLRDHLALFGTCKALRGCYTESVWEALYKDRASQTFEALFEQKPIAGRSLTHILETLFTHSPILASGQARLTDNWLSLVIRSVNEPTVGKTLAKKRYNVTDSELANLPYEDNRERAGRIRVKLGAVLLYKEAAVEALALKAHGGPLGHVAHQRKLKAAADKRAAARKLSPAQQATVDALMQQAKTQKRVRDAQKRRGIDPSYDPYAYHHLPVDADGEPLLGTGEG